MNMNTLSPKDEFATAVTNFVDAFVSDATVEEIDRFLREGDADFYDTVASPEMVSVPTEASPILFHGSFWSTMAWPTRTLRVEAADFQVGAWQPSVNFPSECSERPDLALAA